MKFANRYTNYWFIALLIIIIISTLFQLYSPEKESFSEDKVVFIIPSTSRNMNFENVASCSLINILYESLKKLDISRYAFIIGIDDDDEFYNKNIDELKSKLPNNFHLHFLNNYDKSYVCIVNQLADIAIKQYDAEYLHVFADDLNVYESDYINTFIEWFKKHEKIGLGWCIDENWPMYCTHPFINKTHVEILGYLYPNSIKNVGCDDWIAEVYKNLNRIIKSENAVINNLINTANNGGTKRYDTVKVDTNSLEFKNLVNIAETQLKSAL
jgi:hypothetical protein